MGQFDEIVKQENREIIEIMRRKGYLPRQPFKQVIFLKDRFKESILIKQIITTGGNVK